MFSGNVLLTGCGFLSRGIMRRAVRDHWDCDFTVYSRNEHAQEACRRKFPYARYVLGDVRDVDRLTTTMVGHKSIIHTAALKYVDRAEQNISECIDINIGGTRAVISAARLCDSVETVIGISTDKAVEPSNIYGLSKAVGEKLFFEASQHHNWMKFNQVRYGNVIGSTGSVVPLFKHQYETTGRVRVTDARMTRFWISVDEAVDLIIAANDIQESGAIVIPTPKSMELGELVKAIVPRAAVDEVGLRPGEKMHESLLSESEATHVTKVHDGNYVYVPHARVAVPVTPVGFKLDSLNAEKIPVPTFCFYATDAEQV